MVLQGHQAETETQSVLFHIPLRDKSECSSEDLKGFHGKCFEPSVSLFRSNMSGHYSGLSHAKPKMGGPFGFPLSRSKRVPKTIHKLTITTRWSAIFTAKARGCPSVWIFFEALGSKVCLEYQELLEIVRLGSHETPGSSWDHSPLPPVSQKALCHGNVAGMVRQLGCVWSNEITIGHQAIRIGARVCSGHGLPSGCDQVG